MQREREKRQLRKITIRLTRTNEAMLARLVPATVTRANFSRLSLFGKPLYVWFHFPDSLWKTFTSSYFKMGILRDIDTL